MRKLHLTAFTLAFLTLTAQSYAQNGADMFGSDLDQENGFNTSYTYHPDMFQTHIPALKFDDPFDILPRPQHPHYVYQNQQDGIGLPLSVVIPTLPSQYR